MLRSILIPSACLALLFGAGCKPCDCDSVSLALANGKVQEFSFSIDFDESLFGDDKFTITTGPKGSKEPKKTVSGTYEATGNTIRFRTQGEIPFLSLISGEINKLECNKPRVGQFTITAPRRPPLVVTFVCSKRS